jgi:uncharacterized protein
MIIGTDKDDTLTKTTVRFLLYLREVHGFKLTFEQCTTFHLEPLLGITEEQWWSLERQFYASEYYQQIEPVEGAYEAQEYLYPHHHSHVLTRRGKDAEPHTLLSLSLEFEPHHFKGVHHSGPKQYGGKYEQKWEVCKKIGAKVLIDDYVTHLILAAQHGIYGILMPAPWNKSIVDLPPYILRARNWYEAVEHIELIDTLITMKI